MAGCSNPIIEAWYKERKAGVDDEKTVRVILGKIPSAITRAVIEQETPVTLELYNGTLTAETIFAPPAEPLKTGEAMPVADVLDAVLRGRGDVLPTSTNPAVPGPTYTVVLKYKDTPFAYYTETPVQEGISYILWPEIWRIIYGAEELKSFIKSGDSANNNNGYSYKLAVTGITMEELSSGGGSHLYEMFEYKDPKPSYVFDFRGCTGEKFFSVKLGVEGHRFPEYVSGVYFPHSLEEIGDYALYGTNFSRGSLPRNLKRVGKYAFSGMTFGGSVSFENCDFLEIIDTGAFRDCIYLHTMTFNKGLKTIGDEAFMNCNSLRNPGFKYGLDIPESVEVLGDKAFMDCVNLANLKFNAHDPVNMSEFGGPQTFKGISGGVKQIHVPTGFQPNYLQWWGSFTEWETVNPVTEFIRF